MIFFTSDLHFGSNETIMFDKRPFKNCKIFQKWIIKHFNKVADKDSIIYVIGDLVDCHSSTNKDCLKYLQIVKKIKAKVILIVGNNEQRIIKYFFDNNFEMFKSFCLNCGFYNVKKNDIIKINGVPFYLVHKPKDHKQEMLNLFGHSHKAMGQYKTFGFNMGCDLNNHMLYSEQDIMDLLHRKETLWDKDSNLKLI